MDDNKERRKVPQGANRMPEDSMFYERVVPALLAGFAILMLILILVAAAILLGIVRF